MFVLPFYKILNCIFLSLADLANFADDCVKKKLRKLLNLREVFLFLNTKSAKFF